MFKDIRLFFPDPVKIAAQINKEIINMLVTKQAPDFTATTVMPNNSFQDITLSDYRGKKVVLFFYPLDFTFV